MTYYLEIKRVITAEDVVANQDALIHAMVQFHELTNLLVRQLALELSITPAELVGEFNFQHKSQGKLQRKIMDEQWDYYFHGMDCDFISCSRQRVCVALSDRGFVGTDFVVFRPYEFLEFVKSTREFAPLLQLLHASGGNTGRAFEVMEKHGILQRAARDMHKDSKEWQFTAASLK